MINLSQLINVANIDTTQAIKKQIVQEFNDLLPQISALNSLIKAEIKNYRGGTGIYLSKVDANGLPLKIKAKVVIYFLLKDGLIEVGDFEHKQVAINSVNSVNDVLSSIISSKTTATIIQSLLD